MTTATIEQALRSHGLDHLVSRFLPLIRPAIRLIPEPVEEAGIETGGTRLGGQPDLPPGIEWPRSGDRPLAFLAQVRPGDLGVLDTPLPPQGILWFFYDVLEQPWGFDPAHAPGARVLYAPGDDTILERRPFPDDLPEDGRFPAFRVTGETIWTVPPWPSDEVEGIVAESAEDRSRLFHAVFEERLDSYNWGGPAHQWLGNPHQIQGNLKLECQLVSHGLYCGDSTGYKDPRAAALRPGAADWRLLLQVDSDDALFMWGDFGMLYFLIREQDLAAERFDRAWCVLQCY